MRLLLAIFVLFLFTATVQAAPMVALHDGSPRAVEDNAGLPSLPLVHGVASWYDDGPGLYGAVHSWRFGDRPYRLTVSSGSRSVVVTVRDYCACPDQRVIDLSPAAFSRLAPLSRGLIYVDIGRIGPDPTLPPTDIYTRVH